MPTATELTLSEMAKLCRDAYIAERSNWESRINGRQKTYRPSAKWDGGVDSNGYECQPVWPKIAAFMLKHQLDPRKCIWLRFHKKRNHNHPVMPNQIALGKYLEEYQDLSSFDDEELETNFQSEQALCASRIAASEDAYDDKEMLWKSVILDESLPLSPLFRYCLALSEGFSRDARRYYKAALLQYLQSMDQYDEVWGKWIPESLKGDARLVYCQIG